MSKLEKAFATVEIAAGATTLVFALSFLAGVDMGIPTEMLESGDAMPEGYLSPAEGISNTWYTETAMAIAGVITAGDGIRRWLGY